MSCCQENIICDSRTGDNICLNCARTSQNLDFITIKEEKIIRNEFLQNICANNHIPSSIEKEATYLFSKSGKRSSNSVYAAFCLYKACLNQNVGRSLLEISKMCFVPISKLSHFVTGEVELKPSNLVERVSFTLNIESYKVKQSIKIFADYLHEHFLRCSPPRSSVAIAIVEKVEHPKLSFEIVAQTCEISISCLRRLRRVYKQEIMATHYAIAHQPSLEKEQNVS